MSSTPPRFRHRLRGRLAALSASVLVITAAAGAAGPPASAAPPVPARHAKPKVVAAYFADWDVYARDYHVKDIPAGQLNTLLYAFGSPTYDAATGAVGCDPVDPWADYQQPYTADQSVNGQADDSADPGQHLYGSFNQLRELKAQHPGLKVLISVGGWSLSKNFSDLAATPARRTAFAKACVDTFIHGDLAGGGWPASAGGTGAGAGVFDGIDVDWEYPTAEGAGNSHTAADRHNATLLFRELRHQLDLAGRAAHRHYLLSAALPAAQHADQYFELRRIGQVLDWANVMAYDYHGGSDPVTGLNAPLYSDPFDPSVRADPTWSVTGTLALYLAKGVPASKINLGVPFYGKQYAEVGNRNAGLYQPFDNSALDPNVLDWDKTPTPTYRDLVDVGSVVSPSGQGQDGFVVHRGLGGTPWLYDPSSQRFISYDDPATMARKRDLVQRLGLGGVFAWEISQDSDDHALVSTLGPLLRR